MHSTKQVEDDPRHASPRSQQACEVAEGIAGNPNRDQSRPLLGLTCGAHAAMQWLALSPRHAAARGIERFDAFCLISL